jgi:hypothetical protein
MHGGAHRAPPPRLGAPALTRHLGFWRPRGESRTELDKWRIEIDQFLVAFHRSVFSRVGEVSCTSDQNNARHLFRSIVDNVFEIGQPVRMKRPTEEHVRRFESVAFDFEYQGVPIKVRSELHSEYFTLSIFVELIACSEEQERVQEAGTHAAAISKAFAGLQQSVESGYCAGIHMPANSQKVFRQEFFERVAQVKPSVRALFNEFWEVFDTTFLLNNDDLDFEPLAQRPDVFSGTCKSRDLADRIGVAFADFRGVLLGVDDKVLAAPPPAGGGYRKDWIASPFRLLTRDCLKNYTGERLSPRTEIDLADALMASVEAVRSEHGDLWPRGWFGHEWLSREGDPPEYTVSSLAEHRALYMSALGPQRLWSNILEPVYYIIATGNEHRWQLGRMVDRIHALGVLRLATIKDYKDLEWAVTALRELGQQIDKHEEGFAALSEHLDTWYAALAQIGRAGVGGLLHRIERARYYIENFRKLCEWQRFQRVEGFQTYPELVNRRIGALWDHYERLSARYVQLRDRLKSITSNIQAQKQISLLQFAELAAGPPSAYYGAYVLKIIFVAVCSALGWIESLLPHGSAIAYLFLVVEGAIDGLTAPPSTGGPPYALIAIALLIYIFVIMRRRAKHRVRGPLSWLRPRSQA